MSWVLVAQVVVLAVVFWVIADDLLTKWGRVSTARALASYVESKGNGADS